MDRIPEDILLPDEPYRFAEAELQGFAPFEQVATIQARRLYLCDGMLLSGYGPRTAGGLRYGVSG